MPEYAILAPDETIIEVRTIAATLTPGEIKHVDGKPLARLIRDEFPTIPPGFELDQPTLTVMPTEVVRTWSLRWVPTDPIDRTFEGGQTWKEET